MAAIQILTLVVLAGTACSAIPSRIVGGNPTTIESYPDTVQVDSLGIFTGTWSQSCAGNILNSFYILSAAHCFAGWTYINPSYRRIRAGSTFRNSGGVIYNVVQEINHPTYGQRGYDGDISVVRLASSITYSPVIQQALIINQGAQLADNTPVVNAGWGAVAQGGAASPVLLDVTIYTINQALCTQRYADLRPWPQTVTENMICVGILDVGGKDACQGDSGGPLYLKNNNQNVLVGVVSWGEGCANETYPGVNTKVSSYTNWIVANAV